MNEESISLFIERWGQEVARLSDRKLDLRDAVYELTKVETLLQEKDANLEMGMRRFNIRHQRSVSLEFR